MKKKKLKERNEERKENENKITKSDIEEFERSGGWKDGINEKKKKTSRKK